MKRTTIGGQALIEGVMMKNLNQYATAVRKPDGEIEVQVTDYESFSEKHHLNKIPIVRGIFNFIESMVIGVKTLTYSSTFYDEEDQEKEEKKQEEKKENSTADNLLIAGTVIFSLAFSLLVFMVLPNLITNYLRHFTKSEFLFALVEGVVRIAIFLLYVYLISFMEDIKRVFMYHGAEHKTINCLEQGEPLTPENVLKHSRLHKRCGTSFMIIVMIVSIFFFMFIRVDNKVLRLLFRLLLIPIIAGISYEFIRFAGKSNSKLVNALSKPGLWVQKMTTREPDAEMAEVAIRSVEAVMDWKAYQEAMRKGEIED
ncbi:MAG: DUF1385 domain-containing protein [Lachnospiraceae bacterium]|nr:DUF1385 domain-containing protein [Lachnospiraceae bacterium]